MSASPEKPKAVPSGQIMVVVLISIYWAKYAGILSKPTLNTRWRDVPHEGQNLWARIPLKEKELPPCHKLARRKTQQMTVAQVHKNPDGKRWQRFTV